MLKWIKIFNFQSHKKTKMVFSKGLNAITGSTHKGKSAIFRAIRWLVRNRPKGDGFRTFDTKKTMVEGKFLNTPIITRIKGKKNIYKVENINDSFKAVKLNVPQEIKQILNMDDVNFQSQGDPYFMLKLSPGKRAEYLNKYVGLEIIDDSESIIKSDIKKLNTELNYIKKEKKEKISERKKYKNLKKYEQQIDIINERLQVKHGLNKQINELKNTIDEIQKLQEKIDNIDNWIKIEIKRENVIELLSDLKKTDKKINTIRNIKEKIDSEIERQDHSIKILKVEKRYKKINNQLFKLKEVEKFRLSLEKTLIRMEKAKNKKFEAMTKLIAFNTRINKIKVCPTCKQKVEKWQT